MSGCEERMNDGQEWFRLKAITPWLIHRSIRRNTALLKVNCKQGSGPKDTKQGIWGLYDPEVLVEPLRATIADDCCDVWFRVPNVEYHVSTWELPVMIDMAALT